MLEILETTPLRHKYIDENSTCFGPKNETEYSAEVLPNMFLSSEH